MASCHACGRAYDASSRVSFRATCEKCGADTHACLNCRFHDPGAHNQCRESQAEPVVEKDRANRCDWFQAGEGARAAASDAAAARAKLDALFGKKGGEKS